MILFTALSIINVLSYAGGKGLLARYWTSEKRRTGQNRTWLCHDHSNYVRRLAVSSSSHRNLSAYPMKSRWAFLYRSFFNLFFLVNTASIHSRQSVFILLSTDGADT